MAVRTKEQRQRLGAAASIRGIKVVAEEEQVTEDTVRRWVRDAGRSAPVAAKYGPNGSGDDEGALDHINLSVGASLDPDERRAKYVANLRHCGRRFLDDGDMVARPGDTIIDSAARWLHVERAASEINRVRDLIREELATRLQQEGGVPNKPVEWTDADGREWEVKLPSHAYRWDEAATREIVEAYLHGAESVDEVLERAGQVLTKSWNEASMRMAGIDLGERDADGEYVFVEDIQRGDYHLVPHNYSPEYRAARRSAAQRLSYYGWSNDMFVADTSGDSPVSQMSTGELLSVYGAVEDAHNDLAGARDSHEENILRGMTIRDTVQDPYSRDQIAHVSRSRHTVGVDHAAIEQRIREIANGSVEDAVWLSFQCRNAHTIWASRGIKKHLDVDADTLRHKRRPKARVGAVTDSP